MRQPTRNILLRVEKIEDLFYRSPIPLSCHRLLHTDVEDFIITEAERFHPASPIQIVIRAEETHAFHANEIVSLVQRHFQSKSEQADHEVKKIVSLGLKSLLVGFLFLTTMFLLTTAINDVLPQNAVMITLRELLIILGWVALWRPADLLLFDWRPHKRNAKLFHRIASSSVQIFK